MALRNLALIVSVALAVAACSEPGGRAPSGSGRAASCDPTATSDNGCADGMGCSPLQFDEARHEHVAQCVPGGPADEGQSCGPNKRCRAGHVCNVIPNMPPENAAEPGICFRFCNVDAPLCPGSSCTELSSTDTQWLTVDGVRIGLCKGYGQTRTR